jgi:hypothetical protein
LNRWASGSPPRHRFLMHGRTGGAVVRSRWVAFNESADLKAAGQPAPGADADVKDNAAFPAEFGYHFTPNISSDC